MARIEEFTVVGVSETRYPAFEANDKKIDGKEGAEPKQISVIYGRNGAGKSTIARNLADYSPEESFDSIRFASSGGEPISPNIFVFNEDYIISNFREKSSHDGLDTIIMVGETAELQDDIDGLREKIEEAKETYTTLEKNQESLREKTKEYEKELRVELAENGGWRDRERKITGKNSQIAASTISALKNQLTRRTPAEQASLSDQFQEISELISKAREKPRITATVSKITHLPSSDQLNRFFAATPLSEKGNELSSRIGKAFEDPTYSRLVSSSRETIWSSDDSDFCPYCFQSIEESYRGRVVEALAIVFNTDVEDLITAGKQLSVKLAWDCPESVRELLSQQTIGELDDRYRVLDHEWSSVLQRIGEKIKAPALAVEISLDSLIQAKDDFNETVDKVNSLVSKHNGAVDSIRDREDEARSMNINLAQFDNFSIIDSLIRVESELTEGDDTIRDLAEARRELDQTLNSAVSRQNNTMVACDVINSLLSNIFGDVDRLSVEDSREIGYKVLSRGTRVSPGNLSTGERNAIALAYFFTACMEGFSVSDAYSDQLLIVLDDPLSSFDSENKFGVFNVVRHVISAVCSRNTSSQVLLLSHDVSLAYDFMSVFRVIPGVSSRLSELAGGELHYMDSLESLNVYRRRVKKFYEFGCWDLNPQSKKEEVSGNEFRMVFEAFCEFEYGKDISEVLNDRRVKKIIDNESRANAEYFAGPVYKLFLHGESHTAEAVRSGKFDLAPILSDVDRRRVCRELIALMFVLNRVHLLSIIGGNAQTDAGVEERIYEWLREIESRVPLIS